MANVVITKKDGTQVPLKDVLKGIIHDLESLREDISALQVSRTKNEDQPND